MTMLPNTERFAAPSDSMNKIDSPDCAPVFEKEPAQTYARFTPARAFTILSTYLKEVHQRDAIKGHIREDGDIVISLQPIERAPYTTGESAPFVNLLREAMEARNTVFELASPSKVDSKQERAVALEWRNKAFDKLARLGIDVRKENILSFDDAQLLLIAKAYIKAANGIRAEVQGLRNANAGITSDKIAPPRASKKADDSMPAGTTPPRDDDEFDDGLIAAERQALLANLEVAHEVWVNARTIATTYEVQLALERWPRVRELANHLLVADTLAFLQDVARHQAAGLCQIPAAASNTPCLCGCGAIGDEL